MKERADELAAVLAVPPQQEPELTCETRSTDGDVPSKEPSAAASDDAYGHRNGIQKRGQAGSEPAESQSLIARLRAAIDQAISFLNSVTWNDNTSETDAANTQHELEEVLALLDHAGRREEP